MYFFFTLNLLTKHGSKTTWTNLIYPHCSVFFQIKAFCYKVNLMNHIHNSRIYLEHYPCRVKQLFKMLKSVQHANFVQHRNLHEVWLDV